jgi:hypothetical protein
MHDDSGGVVPLGWADKVSPDGGTEAYPVGGWPGDVVTLPGEALAIAEYVGDSVHITKWSPPDTATMWPYYVYAATKRRLPFEWNWEFSGYGMDWMGMRVQPLPDGEFAVLLRREDWERDPLRMSAATTDVLRMDSAGRELWRCRVAGLSPSSATDVRDGCVAFTGALWEESVQAHAVSSRACLVKVGPPGVRVSHQPKPGFIRRSRPPRTQTGHSAQYDLRGRLLTSHSGSHNGLPNCGTAVTIARHADSGTRPIFSTFGQRRCTR